MNMYGEDGVAAYGVVMYAAYVFIAIFMGFCTGICVASNAIYLRGLFPNKKITYVAGHTFTQRLDCVDEQGRGLIYRNDDYHGYRVVNIDCGMALKNKSSQLGCIRLEDGEMFYVPFEEVK